MTDQFKAPSSREEAISALGRAAEDAIALAESFWKYASKVNEFTSQREEIFREVTSKASAGFDSFKRAAEMLKKAMADTAEKAMKKDK